MARRTVLISPLDIDDESDIRLVGAGKREVKRVWLDDPGFGDFLRKTRKGLNLSLRKAGERIGISHTYLALIEQDGGQRPLSMQQYRRIADAYELDEREVLGRAGCRYAMLEKVADRLGDLEADRFERLMLNRELKPAKFTRRRLELFPDAVRKYIIELVQNVDANARDDGPDVLDIMDGKESE